MLSRSGVYALQAALHLAQQAPGASVSASQMAEHLDLPATYLAKVLQRMNQDGILSSRRGVHGGYRLTESPRSLTVERVVSPFEELRAPETCLLGGPCHEDRPCPAHRRRMEWNEARRRLLAQTTIDDLLGTPARPAQPPERTQHLRPQRTGTES